MLSSILQKNQGNKEEHWPGERIKQCLHFNAQSYILRDLSKIVE